MTGGLRVRAGLALAFVAGIGALLLASSPPTFPSWVAHLVALEFSLALSAAAALALVVSAGAHTRRRGRDPYRRGAGAGGRA
jgi:hypothetical protein